MVELIDNDNVVGVRCNSLDRRRIQRLHHREDVAPDVRPLVISEKLSERLISEHGAEHRPALIKDPPPVRHKQKREILARSPTQVPIVECRDNRLSSPRSGNDKVLVSVVPFALHSELVEHALLMRIWMDIDVPVARLGDAITSRSPVDVPLSPSSAVHEKTR